MNVAGRSWGLTALCEGLVVLCDGLTAVSRPLDNIADRAHTARLDVAAPRMSAPARSFTRMSRPIILQTLGNANSSLCP